MDTLPKKLLLDKHLPIVYTIRRSTGPILCLTERVFIATQNLGAIAYQPSRREKSEYMEADQAVDREIFDFHEEESASRQ